MLDYTVIVDVGNTDPNLIDLDALAEWPAVAAGTSLGTVEIILGTPAETPRQATAIGLVSVQGAGLTARAVRTMTTDDFDGGMDTVAETETVTVQEAASILGVSTQAVRQRLGTGSLPGARKGRDWAIPCLAVERLAAHA